MEFNENLQSLPPGSRLEEFEIIRVLGSGGFGITYLARDTRLGREVVIKENLPVQFCFRNPTSLTVAPRHTRGEDMESFAWSLENFTREAALLAALDHPGIVKVLRSFEAFGTAYFVMPFVEGKPLDELAHIAAEGHPFGRDELVGLLEHVLGALSYLHGKGIFHRDIKPGNILVTDEGRPVLIDFGAARQRLGERSMTVMESPGYTPFEQMQSHGNVGPWSDIYALGATLCKVVLAEAPPKAMDRIPDDGFVPLASRTDLRRRYGADFLAGIDKALAVRTEARWQSAAEWLGEIEGESRPREATSVTSKSSIALPVVHSGQVVPPPPPSEEAISSRGGKGLRNGVIGIAAVMVLGLGVWGYTKVAEVRQAEAERIASEQAKLAREREELARTMSAHAEEARKAKESLAEEAARAKKEADRIEENRKAVEEQAENARKEEDRLRKQREEDEARLKTEKDRLAAEKKQRESESSRPAQPEPPAADRNAFTGGPKKIGEDYNESITAFLNAYFKVAADGTAAQWAGMFTANPYYCYSNGRTTRGELVDDGDKFRKRWTNRSMRLVPDTGKFTLRNNGENAELVFTMRYEYSGTSGKRASGDSAMVLDLVWTQDRWLIDSFKETVKRN